LAVIAPGPVPEAGLSDNHAALSLALQFNVPPPVLLIVTVWAAGLLPPCCAVKDRLVGLMPMAGGPGSTGAEGGEISCANPDISEDNLRIVRPPAVPFPEEDELPWPTAASGMIPVDVVLAAVDPVAIADDGVMLMVARGAAAPTLLFGDEGSLD
jgi:hypothetical protein